MADDLKFVKCISILETAMGTSINALGAGQDSKYVHAIFRMGQILVERIFSPLLYADASFACSSMGWEHSQLLKTLHGFTSKVGLLVVVKNLEIVRIKSMA